MEPPRILSAEAKKLWRALVAEFSIDDPAGCAILRTSLEALDRFLATVRHGCARDNIDYALIRTSMPLDAALTAFLSHRHQRRRVNK